MKFKYYLLRKFQIVPLSFKRLKKNSNFKRIKIILNL